MMHHSRFRQLIVFCCSAFPGFLVVDHASAAKPPVTAVAFAPDGRSVVVASQAGLEVLSWPALQKLRSIPVKLDQIHDLQFAPNGKRLLAAGGEPGETGGIAVLSWPDGKRQAGQSHDGDLDYAAAWRSDSSGWVTASLDRRIHVYSESGTAISVRSLTGHSRGVKAVAVLPDGKTLISGGLDNSIRVWSLSTGQSERSFNNHTQPIHDLAVRPDKDKEALPMVVTVSEDRTVRLWQPTIGRMVRFLRLEKTVPLAVRWTPDGSRLVIACSDGHLRVIDPDTVKIVQETPAISGWAYSVAVHPDGKSAVIAGSGGEVKRIVLR